MNKEAGQHRSAALLGAILLLTACGQPARQASVSKHKVTIGIQISPAMTLLMVAKDGGLFDKQGLDVELKQFTAGKFALQAFLGGSIDFAVSGDVPVCLAILQGNSMKVVAQVVEKTMNEVRVVALKPQNPASAKDPHAYFTASQRKLATSFGGGPEFFTYKFLQHNNVRPSEVQILSQRPEDMPAALETRSLDAISIFDPFAFIAEQRLGSRAMTFREPGIYSELYVLTARQQQIDSQDATITALLKALVDAQGFISANPARAKQIMQGYTKLDASVADGIWNNFSFKPALGPSLLEYWNDETAWAKETGKIPQDFKAPDFRTILEPSFLQAVSPSSVSIPATVPR